MSTLVIAAPCNRRRGCNRPHAASEAHGRRPSAALPGALQRRATNGRRRCRRCACRELPVRHAQPRCQGSARHVRAGVLVHRAGTQWRFDCPADALASASHATRSPRTGHNTAVEAHRQTLSTHTAIATRGSSARRHQRRRHPRAQPRRPRPRHQLHRRPRHQDEIEGARQRQLIRRWAATPKARHPAPRQSACPQVQRPPTARSPRLRAPTPGHRHGRPTQGARRRKLDPP